MIEWFFLYWVYTESAGAAVGGKDDGVVLPRAHEAQTTLTFFQVAQARTQVALDASIFYFMPVVVRRWGLPVIVFVSLMKFHVCLSITDVAEFYDIQLNHLPTIKLFAILSTQQI